MSTPSTPSGTAPVTLTGYLGKDRETRETRERTFVSRRYNPVALMREPLDVTVQSRTYLKLSLATHERTATGTRTCWHDLIVWNPGRETFLARKGDLIQVTGHSESYSFDTPTGPVSGTRFVVQTLKFLRRKVRCEVP
jgi:single-stranded DNA-binding protein